MPKATFNRKRMTAVALVALLAMAAPAFAWLGGWSGYGMGPAAATSLPPEQQEKIAAIQGKYQGQLNELQQRLDTKASELAAARANGDTTVARLNALQAELSQVERRYWTLLDQANAEAARIAGSGYGPYFSCGYRGCSHQHHLGPRVGNRNYGYARYQNQYGRCCW